MLKQETDANAGNSRPEPQKSARRRWTFLATFGLLVTGVALAVWLRFNSASPQIRELTGEDPDPLQAVVNPGYVGIKACAECHAKRVEEFQRTRHYLSCTSATGAAAPGFDPGRGLHVTNVPGLQFEMSRTGENLVLTGNQATPEGPQTRSYRAGLVYGAAGHRDEMYLAWDDNQLFVHPVAWLYPLKQWGRGADLIHARSATSRCVECHNTWAAHVPGTVNQFRRDDMLLGVTCERCHGPGQEHVAHHRMHLQDTPHAIVQPATLARERQLEVCTQCHSNSFKSRGPAFSYRPGQPLEAFFRVTRNRYPEEDLAGNQVQYLRESKCFQSSMMTCVTCHDPHKPHDDAAGSRSCKDCHKATGCKDHPNLPAEVRADCAGCHMPPRVWMGILYHTTEDRYVPITPRAEHRIAVYPEAKQAVMLAWLRSQPGAENRKKAMALSAQLATHWLQEADRRSRAGRLLGTMQALREALRVDPDPTIRKRLDEAIARQAAFDRLDMDISSRQERPSGETIRLLHRLLEMNPNHAKTHGKLGTLYAAMGKREEAVAHLEAVARHDPNDGYGLTVLAWLAYQDGRAEDAAALCEKADTLEPFSADIHQRWGLALLKQDRIADAQLRFQQSLAIDPRHVGGSQGLSETLRRQGKVEDALRHARRAARWTDLQNADVLLTLADAYDAANCPADARNTLELALTVATGSNPQLVPGIRARLRK